MKKITLSLVFFIGIFIAAGSILAAPAKETTALPLFSIIENDTPGRDSLPIRAENSIVQHSQFATINIEMLGGIQQTYSKPAQKIILNLSDEESLVALLDRMENVSIGGYNWIGTIDGIKSSQVIFSIKDGIVAGKIIILGGVYEIRYITDNIYAVQQLE